MKQQMAEVREEEVTAGELNWCDGRESRRNSSEERQPDRFQRKLGAGVWFGGVGAPAVCLAGLEGRKQRLGCTRAHAYQDD